MSSGHLFDYVKLPPKESDEYDQSIPIIQARLKLVQAQLEKLCHYALKVGREDLKFAMEGNGNTSAIPNKRKSRSQENLQKQLQRSRQVLFNEIHELYSRDIYPTIIAPPLQSIGKSILTIGNCGDFLSKSQLSFENQSSMMRVISKQIHSAFFEKIRIVDCPTNSFRTSDWKSIICLFSDGSDWQFEGYPFERIEDVFLSIPTFYLKFEGDVTPDFVNKHQINVVTLKHHDRHDDIRVVNFIWQTIESHLSLQKNRRFSNTSRLK